MIKHLFGAIFLIVSTCINAQTALTEKQLKGKEYWLQAQVEFQKGNKKETFKYDKKAAKANYPDGWLSLGICYHVACGTDENKKEAIKCYLKAIELGNVIAYRELGHLYRDNYNHEQSVYYYQMGIEKGDPLCCIYLAQNYIEGKGVTKSEEDAAKLLVNAVEMDVTTYPFWKNVVAEGNQWFYEENYQVTQNKVWNIIAKDGWKDFCKKHPDAAYARDFANWKLNPKIEKPFETSFNMGSDRAVQRMNELRDEDNQWAQELIARCEWTGENKAVRQNKQKAIAFFEKTSEREFCQDMLIIAKGEGLYNKTIPDEWYMRKSHCDLVKQAAENGNKEAQFTRGLELDQKNNNEREKWYEKASAQGHAKATKRLAMINKEKAEKDRKDKEQREFAAKQEAKRKAADIEKKKNCEGRKIVWTEEQTFDIGKGGLGEGLLDLLGGSALHKVTYTVRYTAIVEKVIADESVKCVIKNYEILDPGYASSNYIKFRKYASAEFAENVGKTRVLEMHEFELK